MGLIKNFNERSVFIETIENHIAALNLLDEKNSILTVELPKINTKIT